MNKFRKHDSDRLFAGALLSFALILVLFIFVIISVLIERSWKSITTFGFSFLTGQTWNPLRHMYGSLPFLYGTLISSLIGLVLATVVGGGTAILLTQFNHLRFVKLATFLLDVLATIPSVVYGLWGLFVLVPWLRNTGEPFLKATLGFVPLFSGQVWGVGLLAAGLILGIMMLPTIISVVRKLMDQVPQELQDGAIALGATRTEKVRMVVLPYARVGILGAVFLSFGRALGETIAVTMVIGNSPTISSSLFQPGDSLASVLVTQFLEASTHLYLSSLYEIGLVLLIVAVLFHSVSKFLVWRVSERARIA